MVCGSGHYLIQELVSRWSSNHLLSVIVALINCDRQSLSFIVVFVLSEEFAWDPAFETILKHAINNNFLFH